MLKRRVGTGNDNVFATLAQRTAPTAERRVECPQCDDTGITVVVDSAGRAVAAPCQACGRMRKERVRTLAASSNLPERAFHSDATICPVAKKYLVELPKLRDRAEWALFIGRTGAGKTTQATILGVEAIKRFQLRVRFYNATDFTRRLIATRKRDKDYSTVMSEFIDADLAILDDFLKYAPDRNSYAFGEFYEATTEAIWTRYDARKPLAITTQRRFDEIATFDAALAGRIAESCGERVAIFGSDMRNWRLERD